MTALRKRVIEDLQLHGYAEKTQEAYLRVVRRLTAYSKKSPDQILKGHWFRDSIFLVINKNC